jgi:hypothetical protein
MEVRIVTVVPKSDISAIRIDKDGDIIPITVGLYRLFLASGADGREAMDLYIHLIFTARLQETQQVRANNVYLARGLSWGLNKVKLAKAWLADAGLIEYVRPRRADGLLGEVYIRLRFLPRADTLTARISAPESEIQAVTEDYRDDLTPDLFEEQSGAAKPEPNPSTGSISIPVVTTGSIYHPVVNQTSGSERQMLNIKNEMLEVRKEKESKREGAPVSSFSQPIQDATTRLECASSVWNNLSLTPPVKKIVAFYLTTEKRGAILSTVQAYSDIEITAALTNYARIRADPGFDAFPTYASFDGFLAAGVEKYVDAADPWTRCRKKPAKTDRIGPLDDRADAWTGKDARKLTEEAAKAKEGRESVDLLGEFRKRTREAV